ncbi:MAG: rhodanese-like domain-containing protein [Methylococcaceae bacterium]|jgi:rhodanese-related sulfurtransferase
MEQPLKTLTAKDLEARRQSGDALWLLDVREPHEFAYCHISGSINIPMNTIPSRLSEIDVNAAIVTICHHGIRSAAVAHFLIAQGVTEVINLEGGVDAFARDIDPTMGRY